MSTTTKKATSKAKADPAPKAPVSPLSDTTPAPAAQTATPSVVDAPRSVIAGPVLRKKELIDLVVERASVKKKDAKPVVDAMLEILGEALADNRELNLAPMGKFKVSTEKALANGRVIRMKGRQGNSGPKTNSAD